MKTTILFLTFSLLSTASFCQPTPPCESINVDFSFSEDSQVEGIQFQNTTEFNGSVEVTYLWDFGNGAVSNEKNPFVPYEKGEYTVILEIKYQNRCKASRTKSITF